MTRVDDSYYDYDYEHRGWWLYPLAMVVLMVIILVAAFHYQEQTCSEYGTVLVTVDDTQRCVPWEQAPDLQDFPEP